MDFQALAPSWLSRWLADGALATLSIAPNIIALTCYAWFGFWLLDTLLSTVDKFAVLQNFKAAVAARQSLGTRGARARILLSRVPGWLLKTWVGLPMFGVVQLVLSNDLEARARLKSMSSGYGWESDLLDRLSKVHFWQAPADSMAGQVLLAGICGALAIYTYFYWSRGFDLVRRIRIVGDAILSLVKKEGEASPSVLEASSRLDAAGWSPSAIAAGCLFLGLINLRIMYKNDAYKQLTPGGYGLFRMVRALGIASALSALHPVVAGLYVASEVKNTADLRSTTKLYTKRFANLPEGFRSGLGPVEL